MMSNQDCLRPAVTVATIVVRDGAFLCVEEETRNGIRINQPAGHLEVGEAIAAAAVRETLEETGYTVEPVALVGIYRWQMPASPTTFVRFAFEARIVSHDPARPLDAGIVCATWLDRDALRSRRAEHRSPLVMRCVEDYLAGRRMPLSLVTEVQ
ncbi:MAG TPA: NUDIX hydrolase [Casimicrobiaceae bacterium]|nr:NUDIX hydrolase [Casimicrobiaceae bacterium]